MQHHRLAVVITFVVSFTSLAAAPAAPAAPPPKAMEMPMPQLPAEGKRWIEGHLGTWRSSDVVMTMGEKQLKGKLDLKCEKASGGWATLCRGKMDMGKEMPAQEVTFMMGWSIGEGAATLFEVSNMGEVHQHTGKWTDDKSITVTHQGKTWDGKDEKDVLTFAWSSPKEMAIKAEGVSGATTHWTISATAKK